MRWEDLFADLEGQLAAAESAELAAEVADRTRREAARLLLADRLAANVGAALTVRLVNGDVVAGRLTSYGPDWVLLDDETGRSVLVPATAVSWLTGLSRASADPSRARGVESKLDLRYALRRLVRDRGTLLLAFADGSRVTGTLLRVGADFVEAVEETHRGETRTPPVRTIPLTALCLLRPA